MSSAEQPRPSDDQVHDLLYGSTRSRTGPLEGISRIETRENAIEYYDHDDELCKITVPAMETYQLNGKYLSCAHGELTAWISEGQLHRHPDEDGVIGPAISCCQYQMWFDHGLRHREDGPAVENDGTIEYWLHGRKYSDAATWKQAKTELKIGT